MKDIKGISPIYILLIVFLVAVFSFVIYNYLPNYYPKKINPIESKVVTNHNNEFSEYTNEELKIKFKYPREIFQETSECKRITVPVKVDYQKGSNIIFIYPTSSQTGNCDVKKFTASEASLYNEGYWGIRLKVANFKNLTELENIINSSDKNGYSKCSIEKIGMNKYKFPLIKGPDGNQMMGDCIAWGGKFNIKINEEENKVILESSPRQQARIANFTKDYKDYDDIIFDSIEFLK
jgi:hypothetical protein